MFPGGLDGAPCRLSQQGFKLGEELLDGIEVGAVRRQEEELGAGGTNGAAHGCRLMAAEVVDDDDVAGSEGRYEALFDIGKEDLAVDRPVDDAWRIDPIAAQRRQEGQRSPAALRHLGQ